MEWFLDKRAKSVGSTASRVVADLHRDLDIQRKKVSDMESLVANLSALCSSALESEIFRLELHRKEILLDLQNTDQAILDRQTRLEAARDDVRAILMLSDQGQHVAEHVVSRAAVSSPTSAAATKGGGAQALASGNHIRKVERDLFRIGTDSGINAGTHSSPHFEQSQTVIDASAYRHTTKSPSLSQASSSRADTLVSDSAGKGMGKGDRRGASVSVRGGTDTGGGASASPDKDNEMSSGSGRPHVVTANDHSAKVDSRADAAVGFAAAAETEAYAEVDAHQLQQRNHSKTRAEQEAPRLEEQNMEETELLASIRDAFSPLEAPFIVHFSEMEHVCIYSLSPAGSAVLSCLKIEPAHSVDRSGGGGHGKGRGDEWVSTELNQFETKVHSAVLMPNHDREFPHVWEMTCPAFLPLRSGAGRSGKKGCGGDAGDATGLLAGAVHLPVIPSVILDVWCANNGDGDRSNSSAWVTTSIDGISFAVVERIYVISEVRHGVSQLVQVDLFGRHPTKGYLVTEQITN